MFLGNLSSPERWDPFLASPVLRESLSWIEQNAASSPEGIHELGEPGWFVNVHGYTTQAAELCTWENHRQTVDLQYLIEGEEAIDVNEVADLGEPVSFKAESDTEKFGPSNRKSTRVILRAGDFVTFVPGEAHRPKGQVENPCALRKLVVKIPVHLLGR
jgi:YhcH/YjgK/YiaL family protein